MTVIKVDLPQEVLDNLATLAKLRNIETNIMVSNVLVEYSNNNKDCRDISGQYCTNTNEDALQYHDGLGWACMYCGRPNR